VPRFPDVEPVAVDNAIVLLAPPGPTYPQPPGAKELVALDPRDGHHLWTRSLNGFGDAYVNYPRPLLDHGRVYASLTPSMLGALDEQTGRVEWTTSTSGGQLAAGPTRLTIVGSGRVTALTKDGRPAWSLPIHHKTSDSALVVDRQRVYVAQNGRHPWTVFCPSS
jgi:outer membrane protein assembly factor BamB